MSLGSQRLGGPAGPLPTRLAGHRDERLVLDSRHPGITPGTIAAVLGPNWRFESGKAQPGASWELVFSAEAARTEVVLCRGRASFRNKGHRWSTTLASLARQVI